MKRAVTLTLLLAAVCAQARFLSQQKTRGNETPQAELTRLGDKAYTYKYGGKATEKAQLAYKASELADKLKQAADEAKEQSAAASIAWKKAIQLADLKHSDSEIAIDEAMHRYDTIQRLMEELEKERSEVEALKAKAVETHVKAKEVTEKETIKAKKACDDATKKAEHVSDAAKKVAHHSTKWAMQKEQEYTSRAADVKAMTMDAALAGAQKSVGVYSNARAVMEKNEEVAADTKAKAAAALAAEKVAEAKLKQAEREALMSHDVGEKEVTLKRMMEEKEHAKDVATHADSHEIEADKWAATRSHAYKAADEAAKSAADALAAAKAKWSKGCGCEKCPCQSS